GDHYAYLDSDSGRPTFHNLAGSTYRKAGAGITGFQDVIWDDQGLLDVRAGTLTFPQYRGGGGLQNFANAKLTDGTFRIAGTLQFIGANIVTNAAAATLDGPAARIIDQNGNDALAGFTTNVAGGAFTIQNGRNFTAPAAFTNAGSLTVGPGSIFTAAALANN